MLPDDSTASTTMELLGTISFSDGLRPTSEGMRDGNYTGPECMFQPIRGLYLIPFIVISIMAIPGNFMVMLAIHRERRLKTPTNVLVIGLAVSDIINGTLSVPAAYFWFVSYCNTFAALSFRFIARTCCGCSVVHLVLISLDRYVSVSKPLKYPSLVTRSRAQKSSIITWSVIVLYMFLNCILYLLNDMDIISLDHVTFVIFWNYFPSSMIVVAMILSSVIYGYVFHQVRKLRTRMSSMMRDRTPAWCAPSKQLRATKTLAIVVVAFAICWLPISLTIFIDVNAPGYDPVVSLGPTMFYYANSVMNPLIYAHRSKDFRSAFKRILRDAVRCFTGRSPIDRTPSTMSSIRPSAAECPEGSPSTKNYVVANGV